MSPEDELRALRQELEKVKEERDRYRQSVQSLVRELFPADPKRMEDEIRAVRENGLSFEQVMEMIKARHGIKP
jgi:predicted  nucleic acid-binding Zn-ribbon protein